MINAVLIDDEPRNRKTLEVLLRENFPELHIAAQAENVKTGVEKIIKNNPQIIFLDIEMPDGTGFDLLRKLDNHDFEIIFTTAHDEYALEAFRFSAIGYLLKPIDENELKTAVRKAIHLLESRKSGREAQVKALVENFENISGKIPKLVLPETDGFRVLNIDEILFLQGDGNYTFIFMTNKRQFHSSHNLGWYENILMNQKFFRISKSHFVNLSHVTMYSRKDGGTVIMSDNTSLPVADHSKKDELKKHFLS